MPMRAGAGQQRLGLVRRQWQQRRQRCSASHPSKRSRLGSGERQRGWQRQRAAPAAGGLAARLIQPGRPRLRAAVARWARPRRRALVAPHAGAARHLPQRPAPAPAAARAHPARACWPAGARPLPALPPHAGMKGGEWRWDGPGWQRPCASFALPRQLPAPADARAPGQQPGRAGRSQGRPAAAAAASCSTTCGGWAAAPAWACLPACLPTWACLCLLGLAWACLPCRLLCTYSMFIYGRARAAAAGVALDHEVMLRDAAELARLNPHFYSMCSGTCAPLAVGPLGAALGLWKQQEA
jgi:hypothetical protein